MGQVHWSTMLSKKAPETAFPASGVATVVWPREAGKGPEAGEAREAPEARESAAVLSTAAMVSNPELKEPCQPSSTRSGGAKVSLVSPPYTQTIIKLASQETFASIAFTQNQKEGSKGTNHRHFKESAQGIQILQTGMSQMFEQKQLEKPSEIQKLCTRKQESQELEPSTAS